MRIFGHTVSQGVGRCLALVAAHERESLPERWHEHPRVRDARRLRQKRSHLGLRRLVDRGRGENVLSALTVRAASHLIEDQTNLCGDGGGLLVLGRGLDTS